MDTIQVHTENSPTNQFVVIQKKINLYKSLQ